MNTVSGSAPRAYSVQPAPTSARIECFSHSRTTSRSTAAGSNTGMLPNPKKTGGGPAASHSSSPGGSALSSYAVSGNNVTLVSPSVWTTQTAACWVAIPRNGKFAYTTNAGSASISSYRIARNGTLTLMNPVAGVTGAGAVDMAFNGSSSFLYALGSAGHTISMFAMQAGGSLAALGSIGVPAGVAGLAAY